MSFAKWWKNKRPEIMGTPEISERDFNLMRDAWDVATKAEREACAMACDDIAEQYGQDGGHVADHCGTEIRVRANAIELTGSPLAASPATGGSDVE